MERVLKAYLYGTGREALLSGRGHERWRRGGTSVGHELIGTHAILERVAIRRDDQVGRLVALRQRAELVSYRCRAALDEVFHEAGRDGALEPIQLVPRRLVGR